MLEINESQFDELVIKSETPVIVDISAVWCGPCTMMTPVLEQLSVDYKDKAKVYKIDFDKASNITSKYGVMSVPTMIIFKNGEEVDRVVGVTPLAELKQLIDMNS